MGMTRGERVRVKQTATESEYQGRIGRVLADSAPNDLVSVDFVDEPISHDFYPGELEVIGEDD
jgi:hypothetical protein